PTLTPTSTLSLHDALPIFLQGKKLPENLRAPTVGFAELAKDALAYSKAHKRSYGDDVIRMEKLLAGFRGRAAESITPRELERHLDRKSTRLNSSHDQISYA